MGADRQCSTIFRKRRWLLLLYTITIFLFLANPLRAQSKINSDSTSQEVYLTFSYSLGLVNTVVTALYIEPTVYLPMGEIFRLLKINYKFNNSLDSINGFYITEPRKYEISFRTRKAYVDTAAFILRSDEFIRSTFDIYVTTGVLESLFGLRFNFDMRHLSLSLETNEELPIIEARNRERRQNMLQNQNAMQKEHALLYPRQKDFFNGGFLDYSLTAASSKKNKSYGYNLQSGVIIAGGDLELTANGNYAPSLPSSTTMEGRWRYVIDENPYISNFVAGYMSAQGLFYRSFKGIQVSNEPVQIRTMYQRYVIEQKTFPQWTVELYLNEKLVDVTKADELGNYRFVVPLTYGTTNYNLRIYGPTGELIEDRQRIQIPFSFIPVDEVNYTISGGVLRDNNNRFAQASVSTGFTSWLTTKAGIEFIEDTLYTKPIASLSLSSWIEKNYIFTVDAAPGALYRADLSAVYASQISGDISVTRHEKNEYYNPSHIGTETQMTLSLPLMLDSIPVAYRIQANRQNHENGATTFITTGATAKYKQINGTIEYRYSELGSDYLGTTRTPVLSSSILYSIIPTKKVASVTTNILFGSSFTYNLERKTADELRLDLSSNITSSGRVQFSYTRNFIQNQYSASMQFIYEFPFARSTTSTSTSDADANLIQNVRGTVGYDSRQKTLHTHNMESVGLSALTMRMFVDKNGNEVYDAGEQTINDVAYNLGQASFIDIEDSGITRVRRLQPYTRYNIDIIESSISNPLWVPKAYTFSTITDPNIYKPINVPFYATGVIEGSVLMQTDNKLEALPGIEIHVQSTNGKYHKNIRVFADGSFYLMGVPPGKYIAYVDSSHLNILRASSDPSIRSFEVRITADGDYVEGTNFLLKKQQAKEIVPVMLDSVKEKTIVKIVAPELEKQIVTKETQVVIHEKPKCFVIHISTWDTKRRARDEARKFDREWRIKTIVEKVVVNGKPKYAVRMGVLTNVAYGQKNQISEHEKQKGFKIHISTWDTKRRASDEAKKLNQELEIKTFVEKVFVNSKPKYAVRIGVLSDNEAVLGILKNFSIMNR
jgi:hypothetical protein